MSSTTDTDIRTKFERYIDEFWNDQNPDVLDELLSDDYVMHGNGEDRDRDDLKEIVEQRNRGDDWLSEFTVEIEDILVDGHKLAARATLSGTAERTIDDVPDYEPPGDRVTFAGMNIMRFEDGKFVEEWQFVDRFTAYVDAGLINRPGDT